MLTPRQQKKALATQVGFIPIVKHQIALPAGRTTAFTAMPRLRAETKTVALEVMNTPLEAQRLLEFQAAQDRINGIGIIRPVLADELLAILCHCELALPIQMAQQIKTILLFVKVLPRIRCYSDPPWGVAVSKDLFQILDLIGSSSRNTVQTLSRYLKQLRDVKPA